MPGVPRPIKPSYPVILAELERSGADQLALESEAPGLDPDLLELCPSKTVPFGCVDNANDSVEYRSESPTGCCRPLDTMIRRSCRLPLT